MSGTVLLVFSTNELKEEKVETVIAAEEFRVSEYHEAASLGGSTFSSSSSNKWNTCLKTEENPGTEGFVPVYATSLLDPSFLKQEGTLNNEVKVQEDFSSFFPDLLLEKRRNSNAALETQSAAQ